MWKGPILRVIATLPPMAVPIFSTPLRFTSFQDETEQPLDDVARLPRRAGSPRTASSRLSRKQQMVRGFQRKGHLDPHERFPARDLCATTSRDGGGPLVNLLKEDFQQYGT